MNKNSFCRKQQEKRNLYAIINSKTFNENVQTQLFQCRGPWWVCFSWNFWDRDWKSTYVCISVFGNFKMKIVRIRKVYPISIYYFIHISKVINIFIFLLLYYNRLPAITSYNMWTIGAPLVNFSTVATLAIQISIRFGCVFLSRFESNFKTDKN